MLAVGSPALAQTNLRVSTWLPPSHPIMKDVMAPWGKEVEAATPGIVVVDSFRTVVRRAQSGASDFELRISVAANQPTPLKLEQFKAAGFAGKVRR